MGNGQFLGKAAAERGFITAVKELRQMERQFAAEEKAEKAERVEATMASFWAARSKAAQQDAEFDAMCDELEAKFPEPPANSPYFATASRGVDVPITVGQAR